MRILKATFTNWCQHEHLTVEFDPTGAPFLIHGLNDAGKTNLLQGICYAFDIKRGASSFGSSKSVCTFNKADKAVVEVKFAMKSGEIHKIRRVVGTQASSNGVYLDGERLSVTDAAAKMTEQWGLPEPDQLISMMYIQQVKTDMLVRESPAGREARLGQLKGFGRLKKIVTALTKSRTELKEQRERVSAMGIVWAEDQEQLEAKGKEIEETQSRLKKLHEDLPSDKALKNLSTAIKLAEAEARVSEAKALVSDLPDWAQFYVEKLESHLAGDGDEPESFRDVASLIAQSPANEKHNEEIDHLQKKGEQYANKKLFNTNSLQLLESYLDELETFESLSSKRSGIVGDFDQSTLEDRKKDLSKARYESEALAAKKLLSSSGTMPRPSDSALKALQESIELQGELPEECPLCLGPFDEKGFASAIRTRLDREKAAAANKELLSAINRIPREYHLESIADTIDSILEAAKRVKGLPQLREIIDFCAKFEKSKNSLDSLAKPLLETEGTRFEMVRDFAEDLEAVIVQLKEQIAVDTKIQELGQKKPTTKLRFETQDQAQQFISSETAIRSARQLEAEAKKISTDAAVLIKASKSAEELSADLEKAQEMRRQHASVKATLSELEKAKASLETRISKAKQRRKEHETIEKEESAYLQAIEFLSLKNGPRALLLRDLREAVETLNEKIEFICSNIRFHANSDLDILCGKLDKMPDDPSFWPSGSTAGPGIGSIAGALLHLALVEQANESGMFEPIETILIDEPTASVNEDLKPAFYEQLTNSGESRAGIIMVEHAAVAKSFCKNSLRMEFGGAAPETRLAA